MISSFLWRLTALLCLAGPALAGPETLPPAVSAALKAAQIPLTQVAIVVQPVDSRQPLLSHQASQPMNPASVMKLLTTYAALDLLGPAYTWKTGAYSEAPLSSEGELNGPLFIKGSGDPKFTQEQFTALLRQLRARGLRRINGDLILDRSSFAIAPIDPGAFDDKPMRPYNVGPDALLINFRALRFSVVPEAGQVRVYQETPSEGLRVDNRLQLTSGPCSLDWKDLIAPRLRRDKVGNATLELTGSYATTCGERSLNLAPLEADAQVDGLFRALWAELGGEFTGQVRGGLRPANARLLAEQESPSLAESVRDINKFSNNVMARQVFLTLGNDTTAATPERARQRLKDWLAQRRLSFPELVVDNGSGLSRSERISADSLNRLLRDAWSSPVMPEFMASLPIVGIDGTMKKRLKESPASGRAHIKTGTLDGVKTVAGYALDRQGRRYTLVCLINHPRSAFGQAAVDALLLWIARQGSPPEAGEE